MKVNRRNFLKQTISNAIAGSVVFRGLTETIGKTFHVGTSDTALAATVNPKKYVFLYLDGGVRFFDFLDPLGMRSSGEALQTGLRLPGLSSYEQSVNCNYFREWEASGAFGEFIKSGIAPVIRTESAGSPIDFGAAAGPLAKWVNHMRLFRGVQTSIEHGAASQMSWCGKTFFGPPLPTLDCLIAGQIAYKSEMLLPHMIMGRSGYVPASVPQLATQIPVPRRNSSKAFRQFFEHIFAAPFDYYKEVSPGQSAGQLIDAFVDGENAAIKAGSQHAASKAVMEELERIDTNRRMIYRSNEMARIESGIDYYLTNYSTAHLGVKIDALMKSPFSGIHELMNQLGLVHHALRNQLTSVATINIGNSIFDCHGGYNAQSGWGSYRQISFAISAFLQSLKDDGLLDDTTVVVFSEMGRDPSGGEHHHPSGTWAMFGGRLGSASSGPRVFGGTGSRFDSLYVDANSGAIASSGSSNSLILEPKHLIALLLEDSGFPVGRETETILGISQAPTFMRKLITG